MGSTGSYISDMISKSSMTIDENKSDLFKLFFDSYISQDFSIRRKHLQQQKRKLLSARLGRYSSLKP